MATERLPTEGRWSQPNTDRTGAAYSETGEEWVEVHPDGSLVIGDRSGKNVRVGAGAAFAVLACWARAQR